MEKKRAQAPRTRTPSPPKTNWAAALETLPALPPKWDWVAAVRKRSEGLADAIDALNSGRCRPLRLGTPCAGFEAPYFALRELGVQHFEHVFSIDVGSHAAKFCKNLNHAKKTWLGQQEGDLMTLDFTQVPSVDILVAGPPCQPFSMMGRRDGIRDPRAGVFWRTIDLIAELARRPGEEALRQIQDSVNDVGYSGKCSGLGAYFV
ncbi:Modification methylase SPRI [Symbiodinium microadriaticum]|uniref:Modification methylase SPRI n=1 Tax=Symbiodinium microadriaticum TaxID=2951 RepID=A0A1Q9CFP8_SYMMI|nr:Modification methylase SPRI [Symbiodinium microadriaticum]